MEHDLLHNDFIIPMNTHSGLAAPCRLLISWGKTVNFALLGGTDGLTPGEGRTQTNSVTVRDRETSQLYFIGMTNGLSRDLKPHPPASDWFLQPDQSQAIAGKVILKQAG